LNRLDSLETVEPQANKILRLLNGATAAV